MRMRHGAALVLAALFLGGAGTDLGTVGTYLARVQAKTGAYTLIAGDCGTVIALSSAGTAAVTLPATLAAGCQIAVVQTGAGKATLAAGSGATLQSPHGYTGTAAEYSMIGATVVSNAGGTAAVWVFTGDGS